VNFITGGFLKGLATDGLVKGDVNGHVQGRRERPNKPSRLKSRVRAEGTEINEYQLLRLRTHSDSREFRSVNRGMSTPPAAQPATRVEFQSRKLCPRVYRSSCRHPRKGEYGLLPQAPSAAQNGQRWKDLLPQHHGVCLKVRRNVRVFHPARPRPGDTVNPDALCTDAPQNLWILAAVLLLLAVAIFPALQGPA